jgi:PAS domain S-box-containing protein
LVVAGIGLDLFSPTVTIAPGGRPVTSPTGDNGAPDPIESLRNQYYRAAVHTPETEAVMDATSLLSALYGAAEEAKLGVVITLSDSLENVYLSRAVCTMLGYTAEELFALPIWSCLAPEELPRLMSMHEQRIDGEGDQPRVFETIAIAKSGERLEVEIATHRIQIYGRPANATFFADIRDKKRAQHAALESESRFRALIESAPDGVVIIRAGELVFSNPAAEHIFNGVDASRIVQTLRGDAIELTDDAGPVVRRLVHADGRVVVLELSHLEIDYEGETACLGFVRDVTERNEMQTRLIQADRLAAMGTLAAGVAHEINNPLAYLMLNVEYLRRELPRIAQDPGLVPQALDRLKEVHEGADRVATIVRDLKRLTRSDEEVRGPVDLAEAIDGAIRIANHQIKHRARLIRTYDDVPPVEGNAARLEQVFLNLIINATHALSTDRVDENRIEIRMTSPDDTQVVVEVSDNGVGMTPQVLERAFEPFFTTKPVGEGTGLGLSICHGLVTNMRGTLAFDSSPGRGTTVRVTLPARQRDSLMPQGERESAAPLSDVVPRRSRVLIVDDERNLAFTLARLLEQNYATRAVTSGIDALELLDGDEEFDAILCDVMMPGMSGIEFHARVSERFPHLASRFVFATGGAVDTDTATFLERADTATLEKPVLVRHVIRALDEIVSRGEAARRS